MEDAGLAELKMKLDEEERTYAELLAKLDELSANPSPYERDPELPDLLNQLNISWQHEQRVSELPSGLRGWLRKLSRRLVESELSSLRETLAQQQSFNSQLVQFLNRYTEVAERRAGRLSELASTLVRFAQRIDRLADAKDRLYASLGNTRTDLLLEAMDKRLETMALGLRRASDRIEGMVSSVALARAELASLRTPLEPRPSQPIQEPTLSLPPTGILKAAEYVAFENRFRGSAEDIRERLTPYISYFEDLTSVLELGCGRGEFLELLRENDIDARGIDDNADMVAVCKERGLTVTEADILSYLQEQPSASLGGIFAAQVIEHLPPDHLREMFVSCHRALREGGRLVVETVNPRSLVALVESFYRDLSHQKPLHPDTVDFLLRACGFREVTIHYSSPVHERSKLLSIPPNDPGARTTNENFRKINALLFGDQDYAAIAIK